MIKVEIYFNQQFTAITLLKDSKLNLTDIAQKFGCSDFANFSHAFKDGLICLLVIFVNKIFLKQDQLYYLLNICLAMVDSENYHTATAKITS